MRRMPNSTPADADPGLLDDPVWHALTGPHRAFAAASGDDNGATRAYRYRVDVAPFAALEAPAMTTAPPGWTVAVVFPVAQMIAPTDGVTTAGATEPVVPLGKKDAAEMMALAELTRPGPFGASTVELGGYLGVRREGRLVAMAGRRLHLPGWIEISAVCTHPDHRGKGLSRLLVAGVETAIRRQGHRAFLHVLHENTRAIDIYRKLGFTTRADMTMTVVRSES
jgi:ribosomal protein S18 acetylase RimI-like enzyme